MEPSEPQYTPPPITGYRTLSADEVQLANGIKAMGEELRVMITDLRKFDCVDQRWISIGETHLQQGIMALVRSVLKPTTF